MMTSLPTLSEILKTHGLFAKKSLGQHFLLDQNLTDKIARLVTSSDKPHNTIVEIGPGPGGLTRSLLANGAKHLLAIEMDERFLPILQEINQVYSGNLQIINANALKIDIAQLTDDRPIRICANLPYNIGTKLLINWLLAKPVFWDRMALMLQKEVAERVVAAPCTSHYGRLAVLANSVAKTRIAFTIPAKAFTPPPKVESAVIVLEPKAEEKCYDDLQTLGHITAAAFGQRRKMLRASLKNIAKKNNIRIEDWLKQANIDGEIRPETLDIKGFQTLSTVYKNLIAQSKI